MTLQTRLILVVMSTLLVVAGSLWIMSDLNTNLMMSPDMMDMHKQR